MITPGHRKRLNRALHELRRPLQTLALLDGSGVPAASAPGATRRGLIELLACALADLDAVVNGGPPRRELRPVSCRELVLASLERWRPAVAERGGIKVFWDAGPALVEGDPARMAQAIDNLIANAIEHGGPPLVITGADVAGRLRITVANGGADGGHPTGEPSRDATAPVEAPPKRSGRRRGDPRRGHGIGLVSEMASAHRGRFALCRTDTGCVAALELPLAEPRLARAA